ncbi:MAG: polysaccharide lyase family 1 protein [Povalibacter sp.]
MRITKNLLRTSVFSFAAMAFTAYAGPPRDLGHETLGPMDGWAASGSGVTGGANAVPTQIYTVTNRAELIAALNNGVTSSTSPSTPSNEPKIIYVKGTIDGNVDDANTPLTCTDYYRNGYTLEAFLATYDPAVWGRTNPTGALEAARVASQQAQQARVRIRVGSNTSIIGIDKKARIRGAWLDLRGTANAFNSRSNIIIRNITFQDAFDCFPQWSPTDGSLGSWNAQYDAISLRDTNNVWIDHNTFEDRETADEDQPHYFGVLYQIHDGLLDITNASDLVTVSWNRFRNHDKMMLIGSSDSAVADRGKLRVTLHHNLFDGIGQRAPRVRYGQVHVYNNYYKIEHEPGYQYSWGVGIESAIYAENNFFKTDKTVTPAQFISRLNGTAIYAAGNQVNGTPAKNVVDIVGAYNSANDPDLVPTVAWTPTFVEGVQPTREVPSSVQNDAGPFVWSGGGEGQE